MLTATLEPLVRLARLHRDGKEGHARAVACELFDAFLDVEETFRTGEGMTTEQEVIHSLRQARSSL